MQACCVKLGVAFWSSACTWALLMSCKAYPLLSVMFDLCDAPPLSWQKSVQSVSEVKDPGGFAAIKDLGEAVSV